jgi:tungstate transport system substrate-binding protein
MRQIAQRHARFLSRGDSSSTHEREVSLWRAGGGRPEWEGYAVTGRGMAATLREANERGAYTLTDETTFLTMRGELAIEMVRRPEPLLTDVHHLLEPVAGRRSADRVSGARALADWLLSPETQNRIGRWGVGRFQEAPFTAMRGIEQLPR